MTVLQAWWAFWALGVIWGSSFLFIRLAVAELSTFQVVFARTAIASAGMLVLMWRRGLSLPRHAGAARDALVLGAVNTAMPFALITWGERTVSSGMAAVLQATVAVFTMLLAHMAFDDERLSLRRVCAIVLAFGGALVLGVHADALGAGTSGPRAIWGSAAIVLASFCYAVGGVYSRAVMRHRLEPLVAAAMAMTVSAVLTGAVVAADAVRTLPATPHWSARVMTAVAVLGVVNTFGAYVLFYSVIHVLGAGRASMVTYVIPPVGLALGTLVLGEPLDAAMGVGTAMIMAGIALGYARPASPPPREAA